MANEVASVDPHGNAGLGRGRGDGSTPSALPDTRAARRGTLLAIASRLLQMVITLLIASFLTFLLLHLAPGNPVEIILGAKAGDAQAAHRIEALYGLDKPLLTQYWEWLSNAVHGDFGRSYISGQSVGSEVGSRLPTTLLLVGMGSVMVIGFGFLIGLVAARSGAFVNRGISFFLAVGLATPSYVIAIVLITIFSLYLNLFPVFGSGEGFLDRLHHLILPAITLALASAAGMARVTRASILEEAERDHVSTAIARGLSRRDVLWRHIVRNAMLPITTSAGIIVASLIAGTVIVENAYGLDGIGTLLVQAIQRKDYAVVLSVGFLIIAAFLIINAIVDVLYALIDPRTRSERTR